MTNRTVSAGRTPRITIENVGGDLSIVGWEGEDLLIKGDEDELQFSQDGNRVVVLSAGDLVLRVPRDASLTIQAVGGDMALRGVNGALKIDQVGGDVSIRDVNDIAIGSLMADFSLRGARGNLAIQSVKADASIREIQGDVALQSVADDLSLRDVRGNLNANVGGDVVLYIEPQSGREYLVTAGDDIMLVMPPSADAELELSGDEVHVDWPGVPYEEDATTQEITLGSGSARIVLNAGGDVRVSSQERAQQSPDEFGNFAGMMSDWGELGSQFGAEISRRVAQATRRAADKAERAARRAEAKLHGPRVRGKVNVGRWNWNIDSSTITPPAPREPVSEQERMEILKMLAEKKITADEADKLLAALEGGEQ